MFHGVIIGLYMMIATVLMGVGTIVVLSLNMGTGHWILVAAAAGAVLALPVTWLIARQMTKLQTAK